MNNSYNDRKKVSKNSKKSKKKTKKKLCAYLSNSVKACTFVVPRIYFAVLISFFYLLS